MSEVVPPLLLYAFMAWTWQLYPPLPLKPQINIAPFVYVIIYVGFFYVLLTVHPGTALGK